MTKKDNIQELFSKSLENHTLPVKPEVWTALQTKMAAAGVASSTIAVKTISLTAKWLIAGAVAFVAAVITVVLLPSGSNQFKKNPSKQQVIIHSVEELPKMEEKSEKSTPSKFLAHSKQTNKKTVAETHPLNDQSTPSVVLLEQPTEQRLSPTAHDVNESKNSQKTAAEEKQQPVVLEEKENQVLQTRSEKTENQEASVKFFPNVFSPNGDGVNDTFFLRFENTNRVEVSIINSSNTIVFQSEDPTFIWDGTHQKTGEPVAEGIYACIVRFVDKNGKGHNKTQLLTLKR